LWKEETDDETSSGVGRNWSSKISNLIMKAVQSRASHTVTDGGNKVLSNDTDSDEYVLGIPRNNGRPRVNLVGGP
jgi:hypothetical protein